MPRYIDADALIDDFCGYAEANKGTYHEEGFKNAITVVEVAPTADVVEIVRCKDCKWYDPTDPCGTLTPNAHRCKRVTRLWMEDDAYCSYGERRTDDGEIH